jgi:hypothetical protein
MLQPGEEGFPTNSLSKKETKKRKQKKKDLENLTTAY